MRNRLPKMLAWLLFGLTVACFATILVWSRNGPGDGEAEPDQVLALIIYGLAVLSFATVGAVVASRVPRNAIGWLCLAMALLPAIGGLGDEYVLRSLGRSGLPGAGYVALTQTFWNAFIAIPGMVLLLFPTGRPPGRRWRIVVVAFITGLAFVVLADVVKPQTDYARLTNPLGVAALEEAAPIVEGIGGILILLGAVCAFVSIIFRYKRALTEERQQLKLLAYSLVVIGLGVAVGAVLDASGRVEASNAVISGSFISIPVSIGFAVLKHRLYDIDVIINRTIVYAVLTAILGGAYVGLVFAFQALLTPLTSESDLAIAGSTLAVAALFRPVRSRVQAFIDRRFYRRKVDAQRTMERFSASLRDEVDLGMLSSELTRVVRDTMQPKHVTLWLRVGEERR